MLNDIAFMDQYLDTRRETMFKGAHTLIYIFDVVSSSATDMVYFLDVLGALRAYSGPPSSSSVGPASSAESPVDGIASPSPTGSSHGGPMVHVLVGSGRGFA